LLILLTVIVLLIIWKHWKTHDIALCETLKHLKTDSFFHKLGNYSHQIAHVLTQHAQTWLFCSYSDVDNPSIGKTHLEGSQS